MRPHRQLDETVIYEVHVKGFSKLWDGHSGEHARHLRRPGARPKPSSIFKKLGVTAVELLPVHHYITSKHLIDKRPDRLLGLQHDRLLRAGIVATAASATRASRWTSSRRW